MEPGGRGTFDGFTGKALGNEAAEVVEVNEVGEFEAVTEGSTGGENRIPQAHRANFYAEVSGASGAHFVQKDNTKPLRLTQNLTVCPFLPTGSQLSAAPKAD